MDAFSKIGFHAGPDGNMSGIGSFMRRLDAAAIPFFLKSTDQYGVLLEAATIRAHSRVDHTLIYRMSTAGQGDGRSYDVPDYALSPTQAAQRHWAQTLAKLPPEFDREHVWVEPINEVDKERADWLGQFALRLAQEANSAGFMVTLFGWSSGEPERSGWETPGMRDYLRYCADHPRQAAVALHEYDLGHDGVDVVYPYHLGRFQLLFDVCDQHGLRRPTVHITEWGWSSTSVPRWETARAYIKRAGALYARYPQIKGAAIWNLGGGPEFGDIHNLTQRLIAPLTDFTIDHRFTVPADIFEIPQPIDAELRGGDEPPVGPGAEDTPVPPPSGDGDDDLLDDTPGADPDPGVALPNLLFVADVTVPDDTRVPTGEQFTKTWLVENSGDIAWGPGFRLRHVGGQALTTETNRPVPHVPPGGQAHLSLDLVAPATPGVYVSDWRLHDGRRRPLGDIIFTRIIAVAESPSDRGRSDARFVADITIPDDTRLAPGRQFTKTWRLANNGERAWGSGYRLLFVKGSPMTERRAIPVPFAQSGAQVEITLPLTAPTRPGTYFGDWQLADPDGKRFGDVVFLRIVVRGGG